MSSPIPETFQPAPKKDYPTIEWEELLKLNENLHIVKETEVVTIGDLENGDWILDGDGYLQPILHLFPIHKPGRQFLFKLEDGSLGLFGDSHLIKYTTELDAHMFHQRRLHARRALKQLSKKSVKALEYLADKSKPVPPPTTAHELFMEIAPHTWAKLAWDGSGDHPGIIALRMAILRTLEAIGAVVEDTIKYQDFAAIFFPETLDATEDPLDTSVTEVTPRFDTRLAAQQLLLLLNPRKYAPLYAGKTLPRYWFLNPGRYDYAGIEIGHITTAQKLYEKSVREGGLDGIEIPSKQPAHLKPKTPPAGETTLKDSEPEPDTQN